MFKDNKGMAAMIFGLISVVVGIIMVANIVMPTIHGTNASAAAGWSTGEIALWGILGLLAIVGLMSMLVGKK